MSLSLDRMIYWLRMELGVLDSEELGEDDAIDLLNMALWNVEGNFDFRTRERCAKTTLVIGQYQYDLSGVTRLDAIASISIIDADGQRHKLTRASRHWLDANANFEDDEGLPVRYLRERDLLTIHPKPDEALDLEINFRQGVADLVENGTAGTGLPRNWDEIIISGAVWRGWKTLKRDYEKAKEAATVTGALINMTRSVAAKEESDSRYARVNVIWEFPEETLEGDESSHW